VDVERVGQLEQSCWRWVCTPGELQWLDSLPVARQPENLAFIFSAKECLYKCQFSLSRQWVDFQDVVVEPTSGADAFEARFVTDVGRVFRKRTRLAGRYRVGLGYVITGMCLPA
jgi:4'-phosphopantetheinyl transferase EntD